MVFIRFTTSKGSSVFWGGTDEKAILKETNGGTGFGQDGEAPRAEVPIEDVQMHGFQLVGTRLKALEEGTIKTCRFGEVEPTTA
ncbi:MAG: hypothetical protein AAB483_03535 [Patescibacteria group bacterium]